MNEKQILFHIEQATGNAADLSTALVGVTESLEHGLGCRALLIVAPLERSRTDRSIADGAERFFDQTADLPYRSLYTVGLRAGEREVGKLVAFFASGCSHEGTAQRLANFAGEQLGILWERIRLAQERKRLEGKAIERAEEVLIARWGIDPCSARLWILRHASQVGRTPHQIATQVLEEKTPLRTAPEPAEAAR